MDKSPFEQDSDIYQDEQLKSRSNFSIQPEEDDTQKEVNDMLA